jgi:hypothetical protein
MKFLPTTLVFFLFVGSSLFSQIRRTPFDVQQVLYYENENCSNAMYQNKYAVIYQNFRDNSKFITYNLNSFQDESIVLYVVNQYKVISNEIYPHANFNSATQVEIEVKGMNNLDDVEQFPKSKVKLQFVDKENLIKDHRMMTAYHFKAKNYNKVKKITYYIDHGSSGKPFSYHESFFEEMKANNLPLIGNVVQRDEISKTGETCTFVLKRFQESQKKFNINFIP